MNDEIKELITLAAKAVGYEVSTGQGYIYRMSGGIPQNEWDPYTSDSDCFRMETELEINVFYARDEVGTFVGAEHIGRDIYHGEYYDINLNNKAAARRLASLRVAAEIGRRIK